jgi:Uma2 family endonuclease
VFPDRTLLTNESAGVSNEPDVIFARRETLASGRLRQVPTVEGHGAKELVGTPDMVLEIVSDSSLRKDLVELPARYHAAGVAEYWLIDARGEVVQFHILRRGETEYLATEASEFWLPSGVLERRFRFERQPDALVAWDYTLRVEPPLRGQV